MKYVVYYGIKVQRINAFSQIYLYNECRIRVWNLVNH